MIDVAKKKPKSKPIPPAEMSWPDKLRALQTRLKCETMIDLAQRLGVSFDTLRSWLYKDQLPSQIARNYIDELLSR